MTVPCPHDFAGCGCEGADWTDPVSRIRDTVVLLPGTPADSVSRPDQPPHITRLVAPRTGRSAENAGRLVHHDYPDEAA